MITHDHPITIIATIIDPMQQPISPVVSHSLNIVDQDQRDNTVVNEVITIMNQKQSLAIITYHTSHD